MYVTTCSQTFPLSLKDGARLGTAYRKRGDLIVNNFVIVTPAHRGNTKELGYPRPEGHGKMEALKRDKRQRQTERYGGRSSKHEMMAWQYVGSGSHYL
jgi:hypothetical protein